MEKEIFIKAGEMEPSHGDFEDFVQNPGNI
jgi:hypothetical protein